MTANLNTPADRPAAQENEHQTQAVLRALQGLKFGTVEVTFHNGNIVQVERREKIRLDATRS